MKKKDIVVVVPLYKEKINIAEQFSITQLYKVLSDYDIVFCAPKRMEDYCHESGYNTIFFDDKFFTGRYSYSELLLSDFFYEAFDKYEYMLIYQLDALVFRDELLDYCKLGFDYIGAPVARRALNWRKINARVGNGGFSLRKISTVRDVVQHMKIICADKDLLALFFKYEDMYFGYCGQRKDIEFSVPSIKVAMKFAIDDDVAHFYKKMDNALLPFGCHGWNRYEMYPLWRRYITDDRYTLKQLDDFFNSSWGLTYNEVRWFRQAEYILSRIISFKKNLLIEVCNKRLPANKKYIVWGYGKHGVMLHKLLKECRYDIFKIFDRSSPKNEVDDIIIEALDWECMVNSDYIIIVSAIYSDVAIKKEILDHNIDESRVVMYRDLLGEIITKYITVLMNL